MAAIGKTGILLVNLGTPKSPEPGDVFHYLNEFLTDERVIDLPWLRRQILVRGVIVPNRYRQSAATYTKVWTEQGSPLLVYSRSMRDKLQARLGDDFVVQLAMRYQEPSIACAMTNLEAHGLDHLIILPLFPQYASATTGSIHQKVMEYLRNWKLIPSLSFISAFATHPAFLNAFVTIGERYQPETFDHVLFSFHGLPERQITQTDTSGCCLKRSKCCETLCERNHQCYRAQCYATARLLSDRLGLRQNKYTVSFQSRLGKEPWTQPYTEDKVKEFASIGLKNVLVFAPAFVADCLETTYEIGLEYGHLFEQMGGKRLQLVESLNDNEIWIEALRSIILERVPACGAVIP